MKVAHLTDKELQRKFREVCDRQDRAMTNAAWIADENALDAIRDEMAKRGLKG
jgi:hypothetical protein